MFYLCRSALFFSHPRYIFITLISLGNSFTLFCWSFLAKEFSLKACSFILIKCTAYLNLKHTHTHIYIYNSIQTLVSPAASLGWSSLPGSLTWGHRFYLHSRRSRLQTPPAPWRLRGGAWRRKQQGSGVCPLRLHTGDAHRVRTGSE